MTERNIMGGKRRIKILTLDEVLMTPEQVEEEERKEKEAKRKRRKDSKPEGKVIIPEINLESGDFKWYKGKNIDKMPEILKDNRVPMSSLTLFLLRTGKLKDEKRGILDYITNYFDTADLAAYSGDEIKYVLTTDNKNNPTKLGARVLSWIVPGTLVNGGIDLSDGKYEKLTGKEIIKTSRDELGKTGITLSLQEALDSKHWRILLRHQDEVPSEFAVPGLHEEYINWVFSEYKNQHAKDKKIKDLRLMGIYLDSKSNKPYLKAWYVSGLENRSYAVGRSDLGSSSGRLVGIAPEARRKRKSRRTRI